MEILLNRSRMKYGMCDLGQDDEQACNAKDIVDNI